MEVALPVRHAAAAGMAPGMVMTARVVLQHTVHAAVH